MKIFGKKKTEKYIPRVGRTDYTKPRVQSYYTATKRQVDSSNEGRRKQPKSSKVIGALPTISQSGWVYVLIAVAIVFFITVLTSLKTDPIISVNRPTPKSRLDKYELYTKEQLGNSVFNLSKFTLQSSKISSSLQQEFPEITGVEVSTILLGKKPEVHITRVDIPYRLNSGGKSYLVSANGAVVGEEKDAPDLPDKLLITLNDDTGTTVTKGQKVIRGNDSSFFATTIKMFESKGRGVDTIRLTQVPREAYIRPSGVSYDLRVYLDDPAGEQIARYFSVQKLLEGRGETPLKYIDLRAGEKVYWQ
jgi:cell division septal protein FtsQ